MKLFSRWAVILAIICGPLASAQIVQVATDKSVYYQGEPIRILVSYLGTGLLTFYTSQQTTYALDGSYTPSGYYSQVLTYAMGPCTWANTFNWSDHALTVGVHRVVGTVIEYGTSSPAFFSVVKMPEPRTDFLLDFEHWPGTTNKIDHLVAYESFGVKFRSSLGSNTGSRIVLSSTSNNHYVAGFDPYPIGFNVAGDFSLPVFGVSAQAKSAFYSTVTMIAKDAQGQEIGRVISPPTEQTWQPLELWSESPIASVEWWPSTANSSCDIDNVWVHLSPKLTPAFSAGTFSFTCPTISGETYQVWSSSNLVDWMRVGSACGGTNGAVTNEFPAADANALFYRVSRISNLD